MDEEYLQYIRDIDEDIQEEDVPINNIDQQMFKEYIDDLSIDLAVLLTKKPLYKRDILQIDALRLLGANEKKVDPELLGNILATNPLESAYGKEARRLAKNVIQTFKSKKMLKKIKIPAYIHRLRRLEKFLDEHPNFKNDPVVLDAFDLPSKPF